ncbi:hypothetical protein Tco_1513114, partial [Tanacetum coccineum]
ATFNAPMGGDPLPLDLSSMGKGQEIGEWWRRWIAEVGQRKGWANTIGLDV